MEFIDMAIRLMFPVLIFMLLLWQILKIKKQLEKHIEDKEKENNQRIQRDLMQLNKAISSHNIMLTNYESTYNFINKNSGRLAAMVDEHNKKDKARNTKRNKKVNK